MKNSHTLKHWLAVVTLVLLVIVIIAVGAGAFRSNQPQPSRDRAQGQLPALERNSVPAAASASVSELARLIDEAIDTSEFTSARWGVCVISLGDGSLLYARNADRLFTPASNMKLYTTAVALEHLGPDFRWRTSVYTATPIGVDGTINGDQTLYGRGAPDLSSRPVRELPASLAQLADQMYQRGVRHVRGDVVGDESYFRSEPFGDGWQWNDIQWYFGAEPSALSIDNNEVDIEIKPATDAKLPPVARLSSADMDLKLTTDVATTAAGEQLTVGIHRGLSDNNIRVWGEFPAGTRGFGARLSVHDPARMAATLFITALKARGITVTGGARTRDFRTPVDERFNPLQATELGNVLSQPLSDIVRVTNKESINLNAELILRTLGRERGELAPDPDPLAKRERGDDEAGLALIRQWLERLGIDTKALALHDGSGLSRLDLVTPEATVKLLQAASKTATASVFHDSLPVAGMDGTLNARLRQYQGRVSAKTGSLTYTNSLSGYLSTDNGVELAFSIICNDHTGHANSAQVIDRIVGILAGHSAHKIKNS